MAVKVITDSTADINKQVIKDLDIGVLSLYVTFNEDSIKDMDISNEEFYKRMDAEGIPISSQPPVGDMMKAMEEVVKNGDDLVCIFLSSKLSGTYQSAELVKNLVLDDYPDANIEIIDSGSTSMELGYSVIEGAKLAKANESFDEVVKKVNETILRTRFIFIPDNLDYLHKGGRIGGAGALFGNMLKITPILTVKDKKTEILQKVRTKKRAKDTLIKKILDDNEKYKVKEVVVHHINAYDEAVELQSDLTKVLDIPTSIGTIGPVVGLHVGPGSLGFAYLMEKAIED